jgi:hypothetical protein
MRRSRHVQDDQLVDCYFTQREGDGVDPPTAEHLADCTECGARYAELARLMDQVRADADAESDAIFTPERLRAQQQAIARRMETVARPARVLSFPSRVVQRTIRASTSRSPRWTAAAAAAGLFLGIALGASYEWESRARVFSPVMAGRNSATPLSARFTPAPARTADIGTDDAFITELEVALDRPHTRELAAFDAFTPHFREILDQR